MSDDTIPKAVTRRIEIRVPAPARRGQVFTNVKDHRELFSYFLSEPYLKALLSEGEWIIDIYPKPKDPK